MDTLKIEDIRFPSPKIAEMIKDPKWRKKMIKHLNHRRERHRKGIEVGKHLSEGEKKATELTHPKTISLLKEVLNDI